MSPELISRIWSIYDTLILQSSQLRFNSNLLNINNLEKKRLRDISIKLEEASFLCCDVATEATEELNGIDKKRKK